MDSLAALFADIDKLTPAALRRLGEAQPGFPSGHDGTGAGSTQPERYEATLGDDAVRDLEKFKKAQKQVWKLGYDMYGVATKWGVRKDARAFEVADPDDEMWCRSCMRDGYAQVRRPQGGVNCDWCATTLREINRARLDAGRKPLSEIPIEAVRAKRTGRRITTRDLERWTGLKGIIRESAGRRARTDARKTRGATFMRSSVTCGACLADLPVPDGVDGKTVLAEHHAGGCAA